MSNYPDAWGLKYTEVQGLTWLSYKENGSQGNYHFPNNGSAWSITNVFELGSFRAILAQGRKKVLALAGTDDLGDWGDNLDQGLIGASMQYTLAAEIAAKVAPQVVVGHSLGGGMASYIAMYLGKYAATINAAPLKITFAFAQRRRNSGLVINYVAPGEILSAINTPSLGMTRVGTTIYVGSSGGASLMGLVARHSLENLNGFVAPVRK